MSQFWFTKRISILDLDRCKFCLKKDGLSARNELGRQKEAFCLPHDAKECSSPISLGGNGFICKVESSDLQFFDVFPG